MGKAYLSLGSNVAPEQNLASAMRAMEERFGALLISPIYRTKAVGFNGPDFLNAAAVLDSDLGVHELNDWLHALEDAHGRDRSGPRFGDRPLDIDIVFYDDLVIEGPDKPGAGPGQALRIPRDELRHAFVLKPLADIAPGFVDPRSGLSLARLWAQSPERAAPMSVVEGITAD